MIATTSRLRKALMALAVATVLVSVIVVGVKRWWLPHYRPALQTGERYGIDVSHHQGSIDWERVASDEMEFAYLKATEGGDWQDPRFVENWSQARAAGLTVGAYHFFRTCTDGNLQADNLLRTVPPADDALPLVIDVEAGGVCGGVDDVGVVTRRFEDLVARVEAERGPVVLYVLPGFEYLLGGRERPMWRRLLVVRPAADWAIWQANWVARVSGIDGGADLNVMSASGADRWLVE